MIDVHKHTHTTHTTHLEAKETAETDDEGLKVLADHTLAPEDSCGDEVHDADEATPDAAGWGRGWGG